MCEGDLRPFRASGNTGSGRHGRAQKAVPDARSVPARVLPHCGPPTHGCYKAIYIHDCCAGRGGIDCLLGKAPAMSVGNGNSKNFEPAPVSNVTFLFAVYVHGLRRTAGGLLSKLSGGPLCFTRAHNSGEVRQRHPFPFEVAVLCNRCEIFDNSFAARQRTR